MAPDRARLALSILRMTVAGLLFAHGAFRLLSGGVAPFGDFLTSKGFPAGLALAGTVTAAELAGSAALALGRFVTPVCVWFTAELLAGIALVHAREGWFVVGGGRNGVEYSVLLVAALASIALAEPRPRPDREGKGS